MSVLIPPERVFEVWLWQAHGEKWVPMLHDGPMTAEEAHARCDERRRAGRRCHIRMSEFWVGYWKLMTVARFIGLLRQVVR